MIGCGPADFGGKFQPRRIEYIPPKRIRARERIRESFLPNVRVISSEDTRISSYIYYCDPVKNIPYRGQIIQVDVYCLENVDPASLSVARKVGALEVVLNGPGKIRTKTKIERTIRGRLNTGGIPLYQRLQ